MLNRIKNKIVREFKTWRLSRLSKKVLVPFDENWFKGKRVAIIGGADSAFKDKLGNYIDGFDVVVRINKGVQVIDQFSEYIGKKTDVLFHCLFEDESNGGSPIKVDLWAEKNVEKIIFSHHSKIFPYNNYLKDFLNNYPVIPFHISEVSNKQAVKNFKVITPYHPTTGFISINTVMSCMPKELYITGVTFFKTPHQQEYRKGSIDFWKDQMTTGNTHNPDFEYRVVKELYLKHPNIIIPDRTLKEIFETV